MKRIARTGWVLAGGSVLGLLVCGLGVRTAIEQWRSKPLPSPEMSARQADSLTPREFSQLEIDAEIRDRLRFDPSWQPIVQAVRADILELRWGKGKPTNPVWKRYGAKVYPLLDYYARSQDPVRQEYGIAGIRALGKPYTTLWLERHVQRRLNSPGMHFLTSGYDWDNRKAWEKEFGLDDPLTRAQIVRLAQQHLKPRSAPDFYEQFNAQLLADLIGSEKVFGGYDYPDPSKPPKDLATWAQFERLPAPSDRDVRAAIAWFRRLPNEGQVYLLVERLGKRKAGDIPPAVRAWFRALATDTREQGHPADRAWAILELERHGDPVGKSLLQPLLAGDFAPLHALSRTVAYEGARWRGYHAYYLLLGLAERYPNSAFARGCRAYGDLTGRSYFNREERPPAILNKNARKTPAQRTADWQDWLARYPNHPGADDATYWLARSLQREGKILEAMQLWLDMMMRPVGDNDARYLAWPHVRTLLDVGLTIPQLETLAAKPANAPVLPLLRYALAVHHARSHHYARALELAATVDPNALADGILGTYYQAEAWEWRAEQFQPAGVRQTMVAMLAEQRQRWQHLRDLQAENTPASLYQLASHWTGAGGWKNGYLPIWDGNRTWHLPTPGNYFGFDSCTIWWACDLSARPREAMANSYRLGSQNAIALALYQQLLDRADLTPKLREKTLFMVAATLLEQWENHPSDETLAIHPPAGVVMSLPVSYSGYRGSDLKPLERDYRHRIDGIVTELQQRYPQSAFLDDLLFSLYFMTDDPAYLHRLLLAYPNGDRADEARYVLALRPHRPKW